VNLPAPEKREDLMQELPSRSGSPNPWSDLESKVISTEGTAQCAIQGSPGSKKAEPSAGGFSPGLQPSQDITLDPETFFPPDPFQGAPKDAGRDPEPVDSPFGTIRRGER